MDNRYYFAGDPSTDSARRHLERVLNAPPRRQWRWLAALFAGSTVFAVWRFRHRRSASSDASARR